MYENINRDNDTNDDRMDIRTSSTNDHDLRGDMMTKLVICTVRSRPNHYGRYEHYSTITNTANGKSGIIWDIDETELRHKLRKLPKDKITYTRYELSWEQWVKQTKAGNYE